MKLTCLAAAGRGGGYHSPASYLLELEGLRFLLDCPVDLSVLAAFAPVPLGVHNGDVGDLISAVPYYWSPAAAAAAKTGGVDAVLVSSATGMLGLPFLTRLPCFANTKVYVTELAARIGKLMMRELVEMHSEFVRYYGPDIDGPPKWMEGEKLDKLMSVLQKVVNEDEVKDLAPFMPLYSATSIDECMQKMQPVKYSEEVCFNGMLMLKASSSGLELGNCVWSIKGPRASITCLSSTVFVSAHALDFDYNSLKENDIILFSDFSSLNAMDEDNENLNVNGTDENGTLLCDDSVLRENGVNEDKNSQCLSINDDIADEIERIGFICSCIMDAIKSGGSVLIPIGRLGVILLILEYISETLHFSNMKVPIFMISGAAEKTIAFTNAVPEWLCKPRQEKLFSGEALFGHVELLKEGRLFLFPHLYSKGLLSAWKEPCIVFCPHWSLRHGTAVHLLRRWHADKRNLLVLEQGFDAELALKPFMPVAMQVLECSFLSGIKARKVNPLLRVLKPKLILFPECMKSTCPLKEDSPWSFLHYSKGKTIGIPNIREEFELRLSTDAAFGLDENITIARLRGKLHLSNGQYVLVAPKDQSDRPKQQLMHWGAVDSDRALSALQDRGIVCSFSADCYSSVGCERSILVTSPGEALVKVTSERTVIYCDDEKTTKRIYDAFSSICNGI